MAAGAALAVGAAGPGGAQTREMTMGNVNPAKHGTTLAADQFVAKVAELTGGKLKIVHHHSGALGGEREVAQQIQLGTVDFGPITAAPMSTLVPEMSALQLPYLFRDYQHVYAALDGSDTSGSTTTASWTGRASSSSGSSPPATAGSTGTTRSTRSPTSRARRSGSRRTRSWWPRSRRSG